MMIEVELAKRLGLGVRHDVPMSAVAAGLMPDRAWKRRVKGSEWLVGDTVSAADLSCCAYLYYDEPFGFDRRAFPNIDRWLDGIAALPGWKHPYDLMPRAFGVAA